MKRFFSKVEAVNPLADQKKSTKKNPPALELKTLINGVSEKERTIVNIRISNKKDERLILENTFYFKK